MEIAVEVLGCMFDEYSFETSMRYPPREPSVDHLWRRYHGLIPATVRKVGATPQLEELLVETKDKHWGQVQREVENGYTPRTLDIMLVILSMEALDALDEKEKNAKMAGRAG
jgi:hypothetical protein